MLKVNLKSKEKSSMGKERKQQQLSMGEHATLGTSWELDHGMKIQRTTAAGCQEQPLVEIARVRRITLFLPTH